MTNGCGFCCVDSNVKVLTPVTPRYGMLTSFRVIIQCVCKQAGFKPAELKFKAHMSQWSKIEAVVSMDTECFIPGSDALSGGHEQQGNGKGEAGKGEREGQRVKQGEAKVR